VTERRKASRVKFTIGMVLGAVFFAGFMALGTWQVRRESWKLKLIHDVTTRVAAAPVAAPGPAQWAKVRHGQFHYLHVRLRGHYLPGKQTLVHGASKLGYGYWVMAPFQTRRGFIVLINRGYVASGTSGPPALSSLPAPAGSVTLTGLLRFSHPGGGFLRHNQPARKLWYSRDVAAIAAAHQLPAGQVAPYFVDRDATRWDAEGPVGGLTKIHFRNAHVGYAITWYLLALGTLVGIGITIWQERTGRRVQHRG
jgi:surfeit locus 1 family protein